MYRQNVSNRGNRGTKRGSQRGVQRGSAGKNGKELVRFRQLMVCLALFLTVFLGKGIFPEQVQEMSGTLLSHLGQNTDFRGAFLRLGHALAKEPELLGELGVFCLEVFGDEEDVIQVSLPIPVDILSDTERRFLNSDPDNMVAAAHYLRLEQVPQEWLSCSEAEEGGAEGTQKAEDAEKTEEKHEAEQEIPAVGVILLKGALQEKEPPAGHTMDQLSLGGLETCTPVAGKLWSEYGYRDHPMDGGYKFHSGVDLGADAGTVIGAFAAGTVEYIGESDAYGNYLQLDHGQGIKSFYAHCQAIDVKQGQQVSMGEQIARVGSTGSATGPHLHLELKCAGVRIDPAYYIQYRTP